ncbi:MULTISPECIES: alpha/beta fold hydrolase [Bacillaceae]|uniref:Alpha/beta hydrolase n=1 Tax=Evansella alkalicola TaxID=745819 RepID=A0ABS6JX65_9BACI|nr:MULTISPECIES: alpha/beta hydrolase [Bacillaceae]MBU9723185.1 alpha/beta hydrolase [Bacillus alkalicola]
MPIANVNGIELFYEEFGDGDQVIISAESYHGKGSYQEILAEAGYKVYKVQLRGYGKSTHVFEDLGEKWVPTWADDIVQFAKQKGIDQFIYTGVSHGAGVGWYICDLYPDVLKAFISVVGVPHDRSGGEFSKQRLQTVRGEGPRFYMVPTNDPVRLERQAQIKKHLAQGKSNMTIEEQQIKVKKPFPECKTNEELAQKLSQFNIPILLLCGCYDDVISAEISLIAAKAIPGAKAIFYQDHSHTLATEGKEMIAEDILHYLKQKKM